MPSKRLAAYPLIAITALAFGFLVATQLRLNLVPRGNQVARNAALIRSVQRLENTNETERNQLQKATGELNRLEQEIAGRSAAAQAVESEITDLRARLGLTRLHGPGVTVSLANGVPAAGQVSSANLVTFQDIQDVVNLLFQAGAEGVVVDGQRVTPMSAFKGSGAEVVIDQGTPLSSPFRITAVGDRNAMQDAMNDPSNLGDLRHRQLSNGVQMSWGGDPDLTLPAFDGAIQVTYGRPG